jgi:tetratricopeptide (TPR) repeat protein
MTTNPKINSILDEANRLFLLGKLQEAISYYDKILEENPNHLGCLNNKEIMILLYSAMILL